MEKWHRDARRTAQLLFQASPFKEHRSDFNVWAIDTPAEQSGIARPSDNVIRRSPLGASYDAFGSERYILTLENQRLRDVAAAAPYEFIEIVVNDRKYGGGGIFNLYATVSADNAFTPYVFVHEFGHHFAGLADEYYTSDVSYGPAADRPEPWEPQRHRRSSRRQMARSVDRRHRSAFRLGRNSSSKLSKWKSRSAAARFARGTAPKMKWKRSFAKSATAPPNSWPPAPMPERSARSKAPSTKDADIIALSRTASCSRATQSGLLRSLPPGH